MEESKIIQQIALGFGIPIIGIILLCMALWTNKRHIKRKIEASKRTEAERAAIRRKMVKRTMCILMPVAAIIIIGLAHHYSSKKTQK